MYQHLEITGLRGFAERGVLNFAQPNNKTGGGLTILVGPNNGGKSTIIEAIRTLALQQNASFTEGKRNKMAGDAVNLKIVHQLGSRSINTVGTGGSETELTTSLPNPQILALPSRRYFSSYFGKADTERENYAHQIGSLNERGSPINFSGRLFRILKNPQRFNAVLAEVLSPVPNWTIEQSDQGQYYLKFQTGNQNHSSEGLGEGIVSLFFIIDALYDSVPGSLIVFDEPELSLHPMLQRRLASLLAKYSKDRQIVYATHSPYFINFDHVINGARVARIVRIENSSRIFELRSSTIEQIAGLLSDRNNPHILGLDAREAFFLEDEIILVEGQEDVLLYPKILQQLELSVRAEFFGWGVGGASKMKTVTRLFSDLGFTKLVGILDGNRPETVRELSDEFQTYKFVEIPANDVRTKPPVAAKPAVVGLLNENGVLREDLRTQVLQLFYQINSYFNMIR